jgi:hypothetical protein
MRLYSYVGSRSIAERVASQPSGTIVRSPDDVRTWMANQLTVIATFVIDEAGQLLIADRHSEHVACAGGKPVRCAGEMTFRVTKNSVDVEAVSNQSTGYCPEPEVWPELAEIFARIGLSCPAGFTLACVFRRCEKCGMLNIVKDGNFECGVCAAELPPTYNVQ